MPRFICLEPVEFDHVRHEIGSEITLPDSAVAQLLELRAIEPLAEARPARKARASAAAGGDAPPKEG